MNDASQRCDTNLSILKVWTQLLQLCSSLISGTGGGEKNETVNKNYFNCISVKKKTDFITVKTSIN